MYLVETVHFSARVRQYNRKYCAIQSAAIWLRLEKFVCVHHRLPAICSSPCDRAPTPLAGAKTVDGGYPSAAQAQPRFPMKKHPTELLAAIAIASSLLTVACNKLPQPTTTTAPMPEAPMATGSIPDVDVTEHVKMALVQSELLKGSDITVATTKGDVRLTGTVKSQAQLDEAVKIARGADGAHAVHDELTVKN
jgi:hypothetical protein